jgi:Flp pilus assembly protein TadB
MRPLYTTPVGIVMLMAGGGLVGLGALWMRKVIKVEM